MCTPIRGRIDGVCKSDIVTFMRRIREKAMKNGRFVDGPVLVSDRERCELRYAADKTSVFPVERSIESVRWRHETNTGIF